MIIINLLSPNQKRELKIKRVYVAIKELVILILLFTLIIAIMLLISKYILDNSLAKLIERNAYVISENRDIVNRINMLNDKISTVSKIQTDFKRWSDFLVTLTNLTPDNISYNSIKIKYDDTSLELTGVAKTRNDLTKLKNSLTDSNIFETVNLPLKDLLSKENNNFTITAKMIPAKIK
ncbi:MAG: PilN domain-containing protein [Candidatus Buchananbacteria bacterium]|nr:PilN domain-containing protein [Candidatus Buchananbacteria bacterium]